MPAAEGAIAVFPLALSSAMRHQKIFFIKLIYGLADLHLLPYTIRTFILVIQLIRGVRNGTKNRESSSKKKYETGEKEYETGKKDHYQPKKGNGGKNQACRLW
jgi:hypothetical protein